MATTARKKKVTADTVAEAPKAEVAKPAEPAKPEQPATPANTNPFGSAKVLAPTAPAKKSKSKSRDEYEITDLDKDAAFQVVKKVLEDEGAIIHEQCRAEAQERYIELMIEMGRKPDSFVGEGERSKASCEMRKRASNLPVDPETVAKLQARGISVEKKVKVQKLYAFNPELSQEKLMEIGEVLAKAGFGDVVVQQPEESIFVTTDATLDELARTGDRDFIREFVEKVSTISVGKFTIDGNPIEAGKGAEKAVTPEAKAAAIEILQKLGVLPKK